MRQKLVILTAFIICASAISKAQNSTDTTAIVFAKAWWHAVTFGDTSGVKSYSTEQLTVTFNSGRTFARSDFIKQVAKHDPFAPITSEWSQVKQQVTTPETAIITNRIVETVGKMQHVYRLITVLTRVDSKWMVAAAQSTREIELAPPVPLSLVGNLRDFVGTFRTPGGLVLKTIVRDSSLVLLEPSGTETRLAAIGPGLFEIPQILSAGNVRFAFNRDKTGKVTHMTRVAPKITAMLRIE